MDALLIAAVRVRVNVDESIVGTLLTIAGVVVAVLVVGVVLLWVLGTIAGKRADSERRRQGRREGWITEDGFVIPEVED